jgi:hypothetical protein
MGPYVLVRGTWPKKPTSLALRGPILTNARYTRDSYSVSPRRRSDEISLSSAAN